jgi:hypothetical protein
MISTTIDNENSTFQQQKWYPETVNRSGNNTMEKRKSTKRQKWFTDHYTENEDWATGTLLETCSEL